jgi:trimeric autotransporter adhesin
LNPDPGNFQITADNCAGVRHSKASCTVSIIFTPFQAGLNQTSLSVMDSAQNSPQVVTLAGTATVAPAPVPTLTTQAVNFAGQRVGTTSAATPVTLKNTGSAPLSIFSIDLVGAQADVFTFRNACVPTLAPGRACTFFVSFTPVAAGQASASVVISDNVDSYDTGSFRQSITLNGTGTRVPVPGLT